MMSEQPSERALGDYLWRVSLLETRAGAGVRAAADLESFLRERWPSPAGSAAGLDGVLSRCASAKARFGRLEEEVQGCIVSLRSSRCTASPGPGWRSTGVTISEGETAVLSISNKSEWPPHIYPGAAGFEYESGSVTFRVPDEIRGLAFEIRVPGAGLERGGARAFRPDRSGRIECRFTDQGLTRDNGGDLDVRLWVFRPLAE